MAQKKTESTFTEDEMEAVRQQVRAVMEADGLNQTDISKEAGLAYGTFTGWLGGSYAGDNDRIAGEIQIWLSARAENRRARASIPSAPAFLLTQSAKRFIDNLRFTQIMPDIGVIAGGAGVGKTSACEHYAATNPNVWHATMQPSMGSVFPMLGEIALVLGVEEKVQTKLPRAIGSKVQGRNGLIIIDEAQHLDARAMEQLRSLHDCYGVGISLVGNESVYSRLEGKGREAGFAQIFSRIGDRVNLPKPRSKDVCALIEAWGVSDPEEIRFLKSICAKPGALRVMTKTLRVATMAAAGAGEPRTIKHIKAAWTRLSSSGAG